MQNGAENKLQFDVRQLVVNFRRKKVKEDSAEYENHSEDHWYESTEHH